MLVEDDPTMLSLLKTFLELEGFEVIQSIDFNRKSILDKMRNKLPSLILMDVHLKNVNGLDILTHIRQDGALMKIPIIMSSGMDLSKECLECGANEFILKPYMPDDLITLIRKFLHT
jgi:DNA-binding response OmpR family regulator